MAFDSRHGPPIKMIPGFTRHIGADFESIGSAPSSSCVAVPGAITVFLTFL